MLRYNKVVSRYRISNQNVAGYIIIRVMLWLVIYMMLVKLKFVSNRLKLQYLNNVSS